MTSIRCERNLAGGLLYINPLVHTFFYLRIADRLQCGPPTVEGMTQYTSCFTEPSTPSLHILIVPNVFIPFKNQYLDLFLILYLITTQSFFYDLLWTQGCRDQREEDHPRLIKTEVRGVDYIWCLSFRGNQLGSQVTWFKIHYFQASVGNGRE